MHLFRKRVYFTRLHPLYTQKCDQIGTWNLFAPSHSIRLDHFRLIMTMLANITTRRYGNMLGIPMPLVSDPASNCRCGCIPVLSKQTSLFTAAKFQTSSLFWGIELDNELFISQNCCNMLCV